MKAIDKLMEYLKNGRFSTYKKGNSYINAEGKSYRYDTYTMNYKFTPYWLHLLWSKAQKEIMNIDYIDRQMKYQNKAFFYAMSEFKGGKNKEISMDELIIEN